MRSTALSNDLNAAHCKERYRLPVSLLPLGYEQQSQTFRVSCSWRARKIKQ